MSKPASRLLAANADPDLRRGLRRVAFLEHLGDGAKEALRGLAQRGRWGRERMEAKASLERLATRGAVR